MFRVKNKNTKEIFLMQESLKGFRLYSTVDDSGNSDIDVSKEYFEDNFDILEELEN